MSDNDEFYDYVVLGTGLEQCILAYILSLKGKKVIQIDKNPTYGSDLRTMRYTQLLLKHNEMITPKNVVIDENTKNNLKFHKHGDSELLTLDKRFNIDITPKFLLANGLMTDFLGEHSLEHLIEFVNVQGSFVFKKGSLHAVPCSEASSLKSGLISLMQKPRVASFFWNVRKYCTLKDKFMLKKEEKSNIVDIKNNIGTINQSPEKINNDKLKFLLKNNFEFPCSTMRDEFKFYKLDDNSVEMIGHVIALNLNDKYLDQHPIETYDKIYFYIKSLVMVDQKNSPFIYPVYGLSEICQAFSRRAGSQGCVFMLNTPVIEIKFTGGDSIQKNTDVVDKTKENVKTKNVDDVNNSFSKLNLDEKTENFNNNRSSQKNNDSFVRNTEKNEDFNINEKTSKFSLKLKDNFNNKIRIINTNKIITDPNYLKSKTKTVSKILTCVCIIKGKIPILKKQEVSSAHIIFLAAEQKRENDVFLAILGEKESCCPEGFSIAIISSLKEKKIDGELNFILNHLGEIVDKFDWEREILIRDDEKFNDPDIIFCKSVDQTTHFETLFQNIIRSTEELKL